MATYSAPTLGAYTLPAPSAYIANRKVIGKSRVAMDGTNIWDVANTNPKWEFELSWSMLTSSDRDTIRTAFSALISSSLAFSSPDGTSATVVPHPSSPEISEVAVMGGDGNFRYSVKLKLIEE